MESATSTIIILATVLFVYWISRVKRKWVELILNWFPPILFAYVVPATFTHLFHLDLSKVYLHKLSREWLVPLAIVTVMSALSMKQLAKVGMKPIVLFVSGSFVIALFPFLAVKGFQLFSPEMAKIFTELNYWKGLVPIVGGWIGGSTSQLVLKELVSCPNEIFLSVIVLDNILVNIWTILMFQSIKQSDTLNKWFKIKATQPETQIEEPPTSISRGRSYLITILGVAGVLIMVNLLTDDFVLRVLILSIAGLALGNSIPHWNYQLILRCGAVLILIIMAILGLRLDFNQFTLPLPFLVLCVTWLVFHYLMLLVVSKALNLHLAWAPIASMANVGGISTAPAVTAAYNRLWMPHAILLAILSMVTGNLWGMFTIYLFNTWK